MYAVDGKDVVIKLLDVPQSSVGAPCPAIVAGEHNLDLAYYLQDFEPNWDGTDVRLIDVHTSEEPLALVRFKSCYAHMFGPPNDEAFSGHPLASRGLAPYSAFRIENSSWIRIVEGMNSVHTNNRPARFEKYSHFVFTFHDSTFECIAEGFEVTIDHGNVSDALARTLKEIR